ncbi:MAG TPA: hypothetical protein VJ802_10560 [Gemmatimonadaceae bacterium]|nr:hypothetical protein [Gemmatimonadaceae bacterium]
MSIRSVATVAMCTLASVLHAQMTVPSAAARPPVRDNSFLVEEAYNQEARVVQHVSVLSVTRDGDGWEYGFTQEWPVGSQRHQLSVTVPIVNAAEATGVGDVALNYRYQLAFDDASGDALAPRLSLVLPTGDAEQGRGTSSLGLQVNLPLSWGWHRALVTHWNVGGAWTPSARAPLGGRVSTRDVTAAASAIWLAKRALNVMLEFAWAREEIAVAADTRLAEESAWISPGLRAAIDFPSGLQIVPGIAFPIGIGPSDGANRVLVYLSFEHGF